MSVGLHDHLKSYYDVYLEYFNINLPSAKGHPDPQARVSAKDPNTQGSALVLLQTIYARGPGSPLVFERLIHLKLEVINF